MPLRILSQEPYEAPTEITLCSDAELERRRTEFTPKLLLGNWATLWGALITVIIFVLIIP